MDYTGYFIVVVERFWFFNSKYSRLNKEITQSEKGEIMRAILFIASIILLVVGILGLLPIGWASVPLWRAILEIVVGALVLVPAFRRRR